MITLKVTRPGSKWYVGWPYSRNPSRGLRVPLYVLPDEEHDTLLAWWREYVWLPHNGCATRAKLLDAIDLAVRRKAPPVPFALKRMQEIIRTYDVAKVATGGGE